MNICSFDYGLQQLFNYYVLYSVSLVGIYYSFKNFKPARLAFITALFFLLSYVLQCDFKSFDPDRIWRYVFWVGLDTIYVLILAVFYKHRKVITWQFGIICFLQAFSFLLKLVRLPDAHKFDYHYTDTFYSGAMNIYNISILVVISTPLIIKFYAWIKEKYYGYDRRNDDDSGMFDARS